MSSFLVTSENVKLIVEQFRQYHTKKTAIAIDEFPETLKEEFIDFLIGRNPLNQKEKYMPPIRTSTTG